MILYKCKVHDIFFVGQIFQIGSHGIIQILKVMIPGFNAQMPLQTRGTRFSKCRHFIDFLKT